MCPVCPTNPTIKLLPVHLKKNIAFEKTQKDALESLHDSLCKLCHTLDNRCSLVNLQVLRAITDNLSQYAGEMQYENSIIKSTQLASQLLEQNEQLLKQL